MRPMRKPDAVTIHVPSARVLTHTILLMQQKLPMHGQGPMISFNPF